MATKQEKLAWTEIAIGDGNNVLRAAFESERAATAKLDELVRKAVANKHKCKENQVRVDRKNGSVRFAIDLREKPKKQKNVETF